MKHFTVTYTSKYIILRHMRNPNPNSNVQLMPKIINLDLLYRILFIPLVTNDGKVVAVSLSAPHSFEFFSSTNCAHFSSISYKGRAPWPYRYRSHSQILSKLFQLFDTFAPFLASDDSQILRSITFRLYRFKVECLNVACEDWGMERRNKHLLESTGYDSVL